MKICKNCKKEFTPKMRGMIAVSNICDSCRISLQIDKMKGLKEKVAQKGLKSKIRKVSKSQKSLNNKIVKIKAKRDKICVICGNTARQLAHLLPKSCYPQYYTLPENLVMMCHDHHHLYDNNIVFRQQQIKLYKQVAEFDKQSADRYFNL